jgi:predicted permease
MEAGETIVIVILGLIFVNVGVGMYAKRKGRSFWVFFILSFILSPLVMFLIALIVKNERKAQKRHDEMINVAKQGIKND